MSAVKRGLNDEHEYETFIQKYLSFAVTQREAGIRSAEKEDEKDSGQDENAELQSPQNKKRDSQHPPSAQNNRSDSTTASLTRGTKRLKFSPFVKRKARDTDDTIMQDIAPKLDLPNCPLYVTHVTPAAPGSFQLETQELIVSDMCHGDGAIDWYQYT